MAFGPETTAEEVVAGLDLSGKTIVVTGSSAGLGAETARVLAKAGAEVVMVARNAEKNAKVIAAISTVTPTYPSTIIEMPNFSTDSAAAVPAPVVPFRDSIARAAYEEAGIDPSDVNIAEVYDLSTALELDWYENIGLCPTGDAVKLLRDGETTNGGRVPVNPSGGLACFGEAVPAQAIAQVCELTWHLRGQAGERQVQGAKVGITANQGLFGHGSSVIVKR